jgi:hypothetical protein
MHVLLWVNKTHRGIPFDSAKPDTVSGVDVYQRAQHIVVRGAKVPCQFLRIQCAYSVN